jgi:hypothetical protein
MIGSKFRRSTDSVAPLAKILPNPDQPLNPRVVDHRAPIRNMTGSSVDFDHSNFARIAFETLGHPADTKHSPTGDIVAYATRVASLTGMTADH